MYQFQKRKINPAAFQQKEVWHDAKGNQYKIDEMNPVYLRNTIAFLDKYYWRDNVHRTPLMKALKKRQKQLRKELKKTPN